LDVNSAVTAIALGCKPPVTIAIAPSNAAGLFQQFKFFIRSLLNLTKTIVLIGGQYSKKIDFSSRINAAIGRF
jgi:hypothetical protein